MKYKDCQNFKLNNMTFDQAKLYASNGYTLLLPGWKGYFNWNYKDKELIFKDGDYILNENQLKDKEVINRNDWYYII